MSNYSDLPSETDSIDQVDATAASTGDQVLLAIHDRCLHVHSVECLAIGKCITSR